MTRRRVITFAAAAGLLLAGGGGALVLTGGDEDTDRRTRGEDGVRTVLRHGIRYAERTVAAPVRLAGVADDGRSVRVRYTYGACRLPNGRAVVRQSARRIEIRVVQSRVIPQRSRRVSDGMGVGCLALEAGRELTVAVAAPAYVPAAAARRLRGRDGWSVALPLARAR